MTDATEAHPQQDQASVDAGEPQSEVAPASSTSEETTTSPTPGSTQIIETVPEASANEAQKRPLEEAEEPSPKKSRTE